MFIASRRAIFPWRSLCELLISSFSLFVCGWLNKRELEKVFGKLVGTLFFFFFTNVCNVFTFEKKETVGITSWSSSSVWRSCRMFYKLHSVRTFLNISWMYIISRALRETFKNFINVVRIVLEAIWKKYMCVFLYIYIYFLYYIIF